ncbi:MAG: hypothetical protein JRF70_06795 [Deltaproteobacteria bacterium]|nr:hypothetical protein [Deltaproteobacteria bacterium]MBW2372227.1 hypothetical protein [Deltaproteobacteria bacterium]
MLRPCLVSLVVAAGLALGCSRPPPVVNVPAQPCECNCAFRAVAPQVGKGCWVQNDVLICPLVKRTLEIEPAYPDADPRCEKQEDGTLRCEVSP